MSGLRSMVNRNEAEGGVMFDIEEIVDEILSDLREENGHDKVFAGQLIQRLEDYGFFITRDDD